MLNTAKLFLNGRSQAVRLPMEFRFTGTEVLIEKDPVTGNVILSPKPSWDSFLKLRNATEVPAEFMNDRGDELPRDRDLF